MSRKLTETEVAPRSVSEWWRPVVVGKRTAHVTSDVSRCVERCISVVTLKSASVRNITTTVIMTGRTGHVAVDRLRWSWTLEAWYTSTQHRLHLLRDVTHSAPFCRCVHHDESTSSRFVSFVIKSGLQNLWL